jgi:hypothetical protein
MFKHCCLSFRKEIESENPEAAIPVAIVCSPQRKQTAPDDAQFLGCAPPLQGAHQHTLAIQV